MATTVARRGALKITTQDVFAELAGSNRDALGAGLGFWDPLGCSSMSFWTLSNEETIGYLRHAEIKDGRRFRVSWTNYVQCLSLPADPFHYPCTPFKRDASSFAANSTCCFAISTPSQEPCHAWYIEDSENRCLTTFNAPA